MRSGLRFFRSGDAAILAVLGEGISEEVNDRVMALYRAVLRANVPQIVEAVPSYTSLLVHYRPELASYADMQDLLVSLAESPAEETAAKPHTVEVPVCYGLHFGPDLWEMEKELGLSRREIIDIHSGRDYRVYMMGFLPGFVYLGGMDERIAFPRLKKPRLHIDAGAVGIAGSQTGIYPSASPGGWRIIGRTPMRMFDPEADPPVPVRPGDFIRFVPISVDEYYDLNARSPKRPEKPKHAQELSSGGLCLKILTPSPLCTVQGGGHSGAQAFGMTEGGAMDRASLSLANSLVGKEETADALEITLAGGTFEAEGEGFVAVTGADMSPELNGSPVPMNEAIPVRTGDKLQLGPAIWGVRAYVAVSGLQQTAEGQKSLENEAFDGTTVLQRLAEATDVEGITAVRFLFGPQDSRFSAKAKKTFTESVYTVSAASDRMGYRLEGPKIGAEGGTDILSDGICFGSVQIPSDGQPIVMMADHQTTGGYAKIATVLRCDLPLLAQLGPGKKIRFCEAKG